MRASIVFESAVKRAAKQMANTPFLGSGDACNLILEQSISNELKAWDIDWVATAKATHSADFDDVQTTYWEVEANLDAECILCGGSYNITVNRLVPMEHLYDPERAKCDAS